MRLLTWLEHEIELGEGFVVEVVTKADLETNKMTTTTAFNGKKVPSIRMRETANLDTAYMNHATALGLVVMHAIERIEEIENT